MKQHLSGYVRLEALIGNNQILPAEMMKPTTPYADALVSVMTIALEKTIRHGLLLSLLLWAYGTDVWSSFCVTFRVIRFWLCSHGAVQSA